MQPYHSTSRQPVGTPVRRSTTQGSSSQGSVPDWAHPQELPPPGHLQVQHSTAREQSQQQQQHYPHSSSAAVNTTPTRIRCLPEHHHHHHQDGKTNYSGLCGSPDTRRTFYKSPRQQQREQRLYYEQQQQQQQVHQQRPISNPLELRTTSTTSTSSPLLSHPQTQHMTITTSTSTSSGLPSSEPIYLDIDPSIHQPVVVDQQSGQPSATTWTGLTVVSPYTQESSAGNRSTATRSPGGRLRSLQCGMSQPPGGAAAAVPSIPHVHSNKSSNSGSTSSSTRRARNNSSVPFVSPYISPTAREYHVPGGLSEMGKPPLSASYYHRNHNHHPHQYHNHQYHHNNPPHHRPNNNHDPGLIMFGDDYDLGSITTGMSQQELLQKRRDVKKRRDEKKYGNSTSSSSNSNKTKSKSKKKKERIVSMPPQLLAKATSWDTSPITTTTPHNNRTAFTPLVSTNDNLSPKQTDPYQASSYRQVSRDSVRHGW